MNKNALIRYRTLDNCLRNRYRKWTLEDLIEACSDTLYEYEGIEKGVSKRTVQADIQIKNNGNTTVKAAEEAGLNVDIQAPTPETPSMTMALEKYIKSVNKK